MNEKATLETTGKKPAENLHPKEEPPSQTVERLDRYELEGLLGKGGFASVYEAYDPRIRRRVAIKRCSSLDESHHARFFREAEIAGNLSHANIVRIFDFGVADGTPFIVQELLSGRDLTESIESGLQLSNLDRVRILLQVAQGLAYAHSHDVIHRDVKPANIRVLDDGSIKLLDFGVAAIQNAPAHLTQDGMTVGTAAYLAPEQIRGESPDRATDIFSFGVVAYELLSGHRPFEGETLSAVLYRVAHQAPEALRSGSLPESLVGLVHECLQKSKERRPANFEEIILRLENALRDPRLRPSSSDTIPIAPSPTNPQAVAPANSQLVPRSGPRAPAKPPGGLEGLQASGRRRAVRDSSIRIQTARQPRRLGRALLVLAALLVAVPLYLRLDGPLPLPVQEIVADSARWIDDQIETGRMLIAPLEPLPKPVGVPARRDSIRVAIPSPPAGTPALAHKAHVDPVSAVVATLEAAKQPSPPDASVKSSLPRRRVSPTARATIFLPPSWHPRMMFSVDGGAFRQLDSRQRRELKPGRHTLTFGLETETYSARKTLAIVLDPAEIRTIESPLGPPGALRFRIIPETISGHVEIDGRRLPLPLANLEVIEPGTHQLVFHPSPRDPLGPLTKSTTLAPSSIHLATFDMRRRRAEIEIVEPFEWNGE